MFSVHQRTRRAVDRLFTRGLPPQRHLTLRDHLRECDACRAYYERSRQLEDALFAAEGLNPAAQARLADLVAPAEPPPARRPLEALALLATVSAAALLALVWWPQPTDELAARGALAPAGELSIFRVDTRAHTIGRLASGSVVHAGDVIQLAYMSRGYDHAVVVAIDAHGDVQWYHPADEGLARQGGVRVRHDGVEEPFGGSWTLTAAEGRLRFYAIFASGTVPVRSLQAALAEVSQGKVTPERLPAVPAHQYTVDLEVVR